MSNFEPLRIEPGVFVAPGQDPIFALSLLADAAKKNIKIVSPDKTESMKVIRIDPDGNSDRLILATTKAKFLWRPLREADGIWMSKFHVPLPVEALPAAFDIGDTSMDDNQTITAYASGDSPYVLGVVYGTAEGNWNRQGGSWLSMSDDDLTFADMDPIDIAPDKAKAFLDLYDQNYVSVGDVADFESTPAE